MSNKTKAKVTGCNKHVTIDVNLDPHFLFPFSQKKQQQKTKE